MSLSIEVLFDENYYLSVNTDVAAAITRGEFTSAEQHYRLFGEAEGRDPGYWFDPEFYAQQNPDVVAAVQAGQVSSLIEHFITFGAAEGRNPFAWFDSNFYRLENPEVATAVAQGEFSSLFEHFVTLGAEQQRSPSFLFDAEYYLAQNTDVAAAVSQGEISSALEHFLQFGLEENREFSQFIDLDYYRTNYSTQIASFYNVTSLSEISFEQTVTHLVEVGLSQGLNPSQYVNFDYYRETFAQNLREFYQVESISQISFEQTFSYLTTIGLSSGFNTSEFIDFNFYRDRFAQQITNFYQVESLSQVSFEQTYEFMISAGLAQGLSTSSVVDFEFYRTNFAQEISSFYGVESITQISFEQIIQYIAIASQTQNTSSSISGLKWNDLNGNGIRDGEFIQGDEPDVVFVIDVSGSTNARFRGTPVGDVNDDGKSNRILDAELAGFLALNQELIDLGFGDTADVGVVVFGTNAASVDMDPSTDGVQLNATPLADADGNGTLDVEDALKSIEVADLGVGRFTDFEDALEQSQDILNALNTPTGEGNIIFLSDGKHNQDPYEDEVTALKNREVNLRSYGVGSSASLADLTKIDQGAEIFTTTDEILDVFGDLNPGTGGGSGGASDPALEPGLGGITIYLDLDNNGQLDPSEPSVVTDEEGRYEFTGLAPGEYIVREAVNAGVSQTFPESGDGYLVQLGLNETVENQDFGNILEGSASVSGTKWIDFNGNGVRDRGLIAGNSPDVIYVVDVSRSTLDAIEGTEVGDVNNDGLANTVLDAQLAGFQALNQQLRDRGLAQTTNVSLVVFGKTGALLDMDLATSGMQMAIAAGADADNNGINDVDQLLQSITVESFGVEAGTSFEAGLQAAQNAIASLGTLPGNANAIFMSDGEDDSLDYLDEVTGLRASDVNLRAFGVGPNASLSSLREIDSQAQVFATTDDLLGVFGPDTDGGTPDGTNPPILTEPAFEGVTVYLDVNENGLFDPNEPNAVTDERGEYEIANLLPGTYSLREVLPTGFSPSFPEAGAYTVTLDVAESLEDLDFGNRNVTVV
ncbi:SdrD B-like domain-containing protein [Phormidium sp. CCY1219]|uniref:SdrD B-like domain-containing protein n=1 Tax=Phormidium sp. CCY1219 TaxID=2886104 RepID=UPI002D1F4453|nr:SdrD B-like domain-containing protein [Phormidium sp. CCY1219]MEB3831373.1 hypothetical protein [Phormidium sp. CCY1219]